MECREGDASALALLTPLRHKETALSCAAERAFMRRLEGGCSAPVAAHAEVRADGGQLAIEGGVWSLCGRETRRASLSKRLPVCGLTPRPPGGMDTVTGWSLAEEAGTELADKLLQEGAGEILRRAKAETAAK